MVRAVLNAHPDVVAQFRGGKQATFGFLVGQVMKASRGKANPKLANDVLRKELERQG
jgi:aspartyl-tRNA(Asn)/glutamyl-tRNA(Gln) amidotransferase subunit B